MISFRFLWHCYHTGGVSVTAINWFLGMTLANLALWVVGIMDSASEGSRWAVLKVFAAPIIFLTTIYVSGQINADRTDLAIRSAETAIRNVPPTVGTLKCDSAKNDSGIWLMTFRSEDGTEFRVMVRDRGRTFPVEKITRTRKNLSSWDVIYQYGQVVGGNEGAGDETVQE
jgi:hypothetical protein